MGREGDSSGVLPKLAFLFPWFELSLGVLGSLAILRGPAGEGRIETQLGETALLVVMSLALAGC